MSEPYTRHLYEIHLNDGQVVVVDDYDHVQFIWHMTPENLRGWVEVIDPKPEKKSKNRKKSGGFG
jgi:hypothetical protein